MKKITLLLILLCLSLSINAQITTYPYSEDFEAGDGGWIADNTINGTWALGTPAATSINSAASGVNAWATGLTGSYNSSESSSVTSPIFDFSALAAPAISFNIWWESEFSWDGTVLQSSIDGGTTWVNVGALGDAGNWFNDGSINGNPGGQQEGWTGLNSSGAFGWVFASHSLNGLAGEASVLLRFAFGSDGSINEEGVAFDDVTIFEVTCPEPSALTFDSSSATTANLSWTAGTNETAWEIVVQTAGTGLPTGSGTATTTNNPHVEMGLTPATNYEAYVRADCGGDFSVWVGPINFATECTTFVAPYTEGFENGGTIPLCWTMSGGEDWDFDNVGGGHIGNNGNITGNTITNDYFAWVDASGDNGPTILVSPLVDVSGLIAPSLSFFELSDSEDSANAQLDVEVWDGAAWNLMGTYNTNTNGWEEKVINLSTLTITGDVQARFTYSEQIAPGDFDDDIAIDDVTFDELPSCPNPSNLVLDSATSSTATLSWIANGTETTWEIVVQAQGTGIPTGSGVATTTNPYVAMGLTASTNYEAYIRADCGTEFSIWVGPVTFTTECATFIAPYTEGFENGGAIPLCWTMSGGEDWNFDNVGGGHIGNGGTITGTTITNDYFAWVDASGDNGPTTLVSPLVDVSGLTTPALSFFEISDSEDSLNAQLDVEVWDGAAWNLMGTYNTNTAGWEEKVIDLSTLTITGDVQARFIFSEQLDPLDFDDDIAIDDVTFDELPTCPTPSTLVLDSATNTTATISWTANTETAWEIVIQAPGTAAPTGAGTATSTNPYVATGLTALTEYEFYIRADCGGDFSDWVGPLNFTTECNTFIAPYTEGFENGGTIPLCWTMSGGEDWNFDNVAPTFGHIGANGTITGTTLTNDYFAWVDASGENGPTTLTTPLVDVSGLAEPALSFFEISDSEDSLNAQLDVEVWDGAAWNLMGTYNTNTIGWELKIINISTLNITGDVQARFIFSEQLDPGDFDDDIAIDDVTFDELPPCLFPNTITTANITETSLEVSWLAGAGETAWEYIVQPAGTGLPTGTGTSTTVTTVTVDMLTAGTVYEVYVRSDCNASGDGYSDWVGPILFSTLPANDECADAIMFTANADGNCTTFTSGSLFGATQSPQANSCNGTANDDVWFSFIAVSVNHAIDLTNISGSTTFLSHGLYEGPDCNNLTNLLCSTADQSIANGLTIGNTYYIRIFSNGDTAQTTSFDLCVFTVPPPITVSSLQYTVEQLVEDVLINSPCSSISNVTSSTGTDFGSDNGIGYFEANGSGFPFESGIIMTSGNAENAPGPEGTTLSDGGGAGWLGDADLEAAINEGTTNNASIIEFDFVPFIQDMSFDFIFQSEEYGYQPCTFSDAFAFLLTDTVTGITTNIALVPGTTLPISTLSVNSDDYPSSSNCPGTNEIYFGDLYNDEDGLDELISPTNFAGGTVPITAMATVIPSRTYHIKLVIADDGDTAFDSAVFLKAGSFEIGEVDLGEDILLSTGNANCEGDEVILDVGVSVGDNATITWYTVDEFLIQEPVLDANGIPENGLTLSVTESNTYQVEIVLNSSASCFVIDNILVEFFPNPITPENLPDILGCETDNSGMAIFDLTENDIEIIGTQTGTTISYYLTEQDAIDGVNPIANPTAYQSTPVTIYYRIEDDTTACFKVSTFNLVLASKPILVQANSILGCDDNADGIANYDLTLNESVISNGQSGFIFSYYNALVDAETSMNAIANPSDFEGIPQTIYVRVEDANGCFDVTTFNTDLAPKPILVQSDSILGCDDDEDGIANYDLTLNESVISNGQSGFIFSYYNALVDAETSTNTILDPSDFDGGAQTIYVRVEDANGCFDVTTIALGFGISPMTSFDSSIVYEVCPNATVPITVSATSDNYTASEVTIAWYNEGVLVSGQTGLTIDNVLTTGTYTIEVMFNETGCTATQDVFVEELETCVIPQGISPNGDGLNDTFDLSSFDVQSLKIFNRNGRLVYEKTTYLDEWHGQSLDGDELPVGTYYYVMNYQGTKTKAAWIYINRESN